MSFIKYDFQSNVILHVAWNHTMKLAGSLDCKELFEDIEMLFFACVLKFRRARINRIHQPSLYQFFEHCYISLPVRYLVWLIQVFTNILIRQSLAENDAPRVYFMTFWRSKFDLDLYYWSFLSLVDWKTKCYTLMCVNQSPNDSV